MNNNDYKHLVFETNNKEIALKVFKIEAKHSGKYLRVRNGENPKGKLDGQRVIQFDGSNADYYKFVLFLLDDGCFAIASKHSGKIINVPYGDEKNGQNSGRRITQSDYGGYEHQKFILEKINNDCYQFKVKHSGKFLDISGASQKSGAYLIQCGYGNCDNQKFKLIQAETLPLPRRNEIQKLDDIPRLESFQQNLPEKTDAVIVGETFIPYFCIKDSIPVEEQIKYTPYYKLVRKQFWKKVYDEEFTKFILEDITKEITYKVGMTSTNNLSLENTLNISIMSDYGFKSNNI